jgi:hypothetical protein
MPPHQSGGQRPPELSTLVLRKLQSHLMEPKGITCRRLGPLFKLCNASGSGERWLTLVIAVRILHGQASQQVSQGQSTAQPPLTGTTNYAYCNKVSMESDLAVHPFRVDEIVVHPLRPSECTASCSARSSCELIQKAL